VQNRAWSRLGAWSWCLLSSPFGEKVGVRVGWVTQAGNGRHKNSVQSKCVGLKMKNMAQPA